MHNNAVWFIFWDQVVSPIITKCVNKSQQVYILIIKIFDGWIANLIIEGMFNVPLCEITDSDVMLTVICQTTKRKNMAIFVVPTNLFYLFTVIFLNVDSP